jgi:hypothetical protein
MLASLYAMFSNAELLLAASRSEQAKIDRREQGQGELETLRLARFTPNPLGICGRAASFVGAARLAAG